MLRKRRRVLVSVRTAAEARVTIAGGVDFLDLKEPSRGALGACDFEVMREIAGLIGGETTLTVALGELLECQNGRFAGRLPGEVSLFKFGLAGCGQRNDWREIWKSATAELAGTSEPVLVGYADWEVAKSPALEEVFAFGMEAGVGYVLIDTYLKDGRGLWEHIGLEELVGWQRLAMKHGIQLAIAGALRLGDLDQLDDFPGDVIVGMRSGVCDEGLREGVLSRERVEKFVEWAHDAKQISQSLCVPQERET